MMKINKNGIFKMFTKEKDYCSFIIIFLDEEGN